MTTDPSPEAIDCCAVILAGGLNSRMGGRNKALLEVGGKRIVDRILEVLDSVFSEILLVTREPRQYEGLPIKVVQDVYDIRASLTGLHAGLKHAQADFGFVVPCDVPFLNPHLIRAILDQVTPEVDVVVPQDGDFFEPLCAVYSKRCLPYIEAMLSRGDLKIYHFFDKIRLRTIPMEKLSPADPGRRSFINVNTPDVYRSLKNNFE
jgi:molybdopterin-guanine dinucleotide biosynthesis protein A